MSGIMRAAAGSSDAVTKGLGVAAFACFLLGRISLTDFVVMAALVTLWLSHTTTMDLPPLPPAAK